MTYKPTYSVTEILGMRAKGLTYREIGRCTGISGARVGHLIQAAERGARVAKRTSAMREKLQASNECTRKLPVEDVLCLLDLSAKAKYRLRKWCEWEGIRRIMAIQHTSRTGKTYYLHARTAKTGKPKCFFSPKPAGKPIDIIPDGFEIYENCVGKSRECESK